ncbi:MAG: hypothetical protein FJ135_03000 [Deltaproteobacteria bacterium]|nr:hypothetical protein [Deltaproteobacteria bacterium]
MMQLVDRLEKQLSSPKGRLQWFFDFLSRDIDSLPHLDALVVLYGLKRITDKTYLTKDDEIKTVFQDGTFERKGLKEVQGLLKEILEGVLECKKKILPPKDNETAISRAIRLAQRYYVKNIELRMVIYVENKKVRMEAFDNNYVILSKFLDDLGHFSVESIRICEREDCNKYFLKATAKDKRYCSNKCAWVINARKKRAMSQGR